MGARLRGLFLLAGLAFLALGCARALADGSVTLPGWRVLAAAVALTTCGLVASTAAWVEINDGRAPRRRLWAGFLAAQLGKYIPGGIWVGVGNIGFGMGAGLTASQATGALAVYALCLVSAAGLVAGVTAPLQAPPMLWAVALILLVPLLQVRRRLARIAAWGGRRLPDRMGALELPGQTPILACLARLLVAQTAAATTYWLLLAGAGEALPLTTVLCAFGLAWLSGFLAIGFPAGLGAREAVLVLLLDAGTGAVVTASVLHRLLQALGELILLAASRRSVPAASAAPAASPLASNWRSP
jgi:hypothetical protein